MQSFFFRIDGGPDTPCAAVDIVYAPIPGDFRKDRVVVHLAGYGLIDLPRWATHWTASAPTTGES